MAEIVQIIAVTHNPMLARALKAPTLSAGMTRGRQLWEEMRAKLTAARPNAIVIAANDHANQWFMDNMAAFLVGKSPRHGAP